METIMKLGNYGITKTACLMMIFVFVAPMALAASEYESSENIAAGIIRTAGPSATYEANVFSTDPEDFGQDLYMKVYNRVRNEPADKAVSRALAAHPFSKEEYFAALSGESLQRLLEKETAGEPLTPDSPEAKQKKLLQAIAEEKILAELETSSQIEATQTELFANGDESDSGFDLIADLEIIDLILFGDTQSSLSGTGPGAPPGANIANVGDAIINVISDAISGDEGDAAAAPKPPGGSAGTVSGTPPGGSGAPSGGGAAGGSLSPGELSPEELATVCPANQSFNDAVLAAKEREREAAERRGEREDGDDRGDSGDRRDSDGEGEGGGGEEDTAPFAGDAETPATPGNWTRPKQCIDGSKDYFLAEEVSDFFCLTGEFKYKTESSYLPSKSCIACHFEKMNDAFKKTLSHNLVPSKATGNLFESAKCKRGMQLSENIKWSLVLVPQPILTPPNDDLVPRADFIKNFVDEMTRNLGGPKIQDKTAEAAQHLLNSSGSDTEQDKLLTQLRQQIQKKTDEAVQTMKTTQLANDAENQATQFQVLLNEIDTMNAYFEGFMTTFISLSTKQTDSPCKVLLDKPQCS